MTLLEFAEKDTGALDYFIKRYGHYEHEFEEDETQRHVKKLKIIPAQNLAGETRKVPCVEVSIYCFVTGLYSFVS